MENNKVTLDLETYHKLYDFYNNMNKDTVYLYDGYSRIMTHDEAVKVLVKDHNSQLEYCRKEIRALQNANAILRDEGIKNTSLWKFIKMKWL